MRLEDLPDYTAYLSDSGLYILDGTTPVPVADVMAWATWMHQQGPQLLVERTQLTHEVLVSTVFLGIDHGLPFGPPQLFETMVFWEGSPHHLDCKRCGRWADALQQHAAVVARIQSVAVTPGNFCC